MISKSLIEMTKGRVREFVREPSAMWFVVLMPIVWMLALGFIFTGENKEIHSIGIEKIGAYEKIESILKNSASTFKIVKADEKKLKTFMQRGDISIMISSDKMDEIFYRYDEHNDAARKAHMYADYAIQKDLGRKDVIKATIEPIKVKGSRYIDFLVPSLLALSIMTTSLFGTGMTIVVNRRENLLKRYLTTPMKPYEYIISHILGRYTILVMEIFVITLFAWVVFDFKVMGNFVSYIILSLLGAGAFAAIGIYFGARTKDAGRYNGTVNLVTLPTMMLSGVWFSRSAFPDWLRNISDYLPLTPLVDGLRRVALEGAGLLDLVPEVSILLAYIVVVTVLARHRFKWY